MRQLKALPLNIKNKMISLLKIIKKNIIAICIIFITLIITTFATSIITQKSSKAKAIIFTTTGVVGQNDSLSHVQGSAYFAETIQGWLKNPILIEQVNQNIAINLNTIDINFSINAYRQERQNMVIEITSSTKKNLEQISKELFLILQNKINIYNKKTKSDFILINQGISIIDISSFSIIYLFAAVILATIIISYLWIQFLRMSQLIKKEN